MFATAGMFDLLADEGASDADVSSNASSEKPSSFLMPLKNKNQNTSEKTVNSGNPLLDTKVDMHLDNASLQWKKIPGLDSKFWAEFSNRLRVYGTEDEVCILNKLGNAVGGTSRVEHAGKK
jgi:hypothetical protein